MDSATQTSLHLLTVPRIVRMGNQIGYRVTGHFNHPLTEIICFSFAWTEKDGVLKAEFIHYGYLCEVEITVPKYGH